MSVEEFRQEVDKLDNAYVSTDYEDINKGYGTLQSYIETAKMKNDESSEKVSQVTDNHDSSKQYNSGS